MSELANFESGGDCASEATIPDPVIAAPTPATETPVLNPDAWRVEVAARLERYRTRRKPRTPRYPSLLLPLAGPESWSRPAPPTGSAAVATAPARAEQDFALPINEDPTALEAPSFAEPRQASQQSQEQGQIGRAH